jgi:anti-sigma factor RsiW
MNEHVTQAALEAYVIGALEELEAARVEEHVASCQSCAAQLQREAALEVAFTAVVSARPRPRISHLSAAAGAGLAIAAAMLLWLVPRGEHAPSPAANDEPSPTVVEMSGDASTATASLELQVDGARAGVRD